MRFKSALLTVATALTIGGFAQAETVDAGSPFSVISALKDEGYRADLEVDSYGDPMIESATQGVNYQIYFYGCSDNRDCKDLQFRAGFSTPDSMSAASANSWNQQKFIGKVYVDDEGDPWIEMAVPGAMDLTEQSFERVLARWNTALEEFLEYIDW